MEETQYPSGGMSSSPVISTLATSTFFVAFWSCISFKKSKKWSSHPVVIWTKPFCTSLHPSRLCIELCTQAAATFQCLNRHWLLHPIRANQVRHLTPGSSRVPAAPFHLCMSIWPRECVRLLAGTPLLPSDAWRSEGRDPQQKLVCVVSFFCVFCLSVQELQLLKSALPLIKPCSLHPGLCVAFISCVTQLKAFKNVLFFWISQKKVWSWFFFFFQFERELNKSQVFWFGLSAANWIAFYVQNQNQVQE